MTVFDHLHRRILAAAGLMEIEKPVCGCSIDDLRKSEWSPRFEQLMRNRLVMGALRYGKIHAANKPAYDRIGAAHKRLEKYSATGNLEFLVDVANMVLLEFEVPRHPNAHWQDVHGDHCHSK